MKFQCPACNKRKNISFFKSITKDLSFKGYEYRKCTNCLSIFLCCKNLNELKLKKLHQKNWRKKGIFKFKTLSPNISDTPPTSSSINSWVQLLKDLKLKKNSSVLDVGCGDGGMLIAMKKMGLSDLSGFDADSVMIKKLKKNYDINFFLSDFENFYKKENILKKKFNYIFLNGVLEHTFNPAVMLKNVSKVCDISSNIFIKIPSGQSLQMKFLKEYNWSSFAPFHRTLFSKKGLEILLKKNGFIKIKFIKKFTKMYGWTRGISWKFNFQKEYEKLRKYNNFRKFDFFIDDLFETIANEYEGPSYIFLKSKLKNYVKENYLFE